MQTESTLATDYAFVRSSEESYDPKPYLHCKLRSRTTVLCWAGLKTHVHTTKCANCAGTKLARNLGMSLRLRNSCDTPQDSNTCCQLQGRLQLLSCSSTPSRCTLPHTLPSWSKDHNCAQLKWGTTQCSKMGAIQGSGTWILGINYNNGNIRTI